jgi:hypothetical protein
MDFWFLSKTPPCPESLSVWRKDLVSVPMACGKRKPAQIGQMDAPNTPGDLIPMQQVETLRFQSRPQLRQSGDTAHRLQGEGEV